MIDPDYYYESVYNIPYNELWDKNIRYLLFDLDNTLAPYDVARPSAKVVALVKRLQRIGFKISLLTNNTERRIATFNERLNLVAVHGAMKPLTTGIGRAMRELGAVREQTAIIGDQLFTDIWAGKLSKLTTILVKPASKKDIITVRWKRIIERPFIRKYQAKLNKPIVRTDAENPDE